MRTQLKTVDLGPVSLAAPADPPRHVVAEHGHLWQWVGSGQELISLSVAVRDTRLGTPTGVAHHLAWEVRDVRSGLGGGSAGSTEREVPVHLPGAVGAAAADVAGVVHGVDVLNRIVVTATGDHMHVVRVLVPANDEGRDLCDAVVASLQVHPGWVRS